MADWWGNGPNAGKPVMPLNADWWTSGGDAAVPRGASQLASAAPSAAGVPARSLDFKAPGAGLANAGIDDQDMYPRFEKLRAHKDEKAGGNRQLWKNLDRWENTPQGANVDPEQKKLFDLYHRTGQRDPRLKDSTVAAALDWGVREGTRSQVHKKTFMSSALGKLLGIPITAAGFAIGGPLGAGVANGLYQGVGNHDVLAGLGGFAGGYAGGSLGGKLLGVGGNAAGLPGGGTITGMLGGNAPLTNINGLFPGQAGRDIASRAGTQWLGPSTERLVTKGASATGKALRNRQRRKDAEKAFSRQLAGP